MSTGIINIDDFAKVEIKIGEIIKVELIEESNKMLLLTVDFGEEESRTVLSGIRKHFDNPVEELIGVKNPFVTNLAPREMLGHTSQAMIMAAGDGEHFSLMKVDDAVANGTKIK